MQKEYASLKHKYFCHDCDWQVLHVCVNDRFLKYKNAADWDWWLYCTNKVCKNHDGEGIFQSVPDWVYESKDKTVWLNPEDVRKSEEYK